MHGKLTKGSLVEGDRRWTESGALGRHLGVRIVILVGILMGWYVV